MGRSKAKKCPDCQGYGFTTSLKGQLNENINKIEITGEYNELCYKCRGIGIVGVKQLNSLTANQLCNLVHEKSYDQLFEMLNNKTSQELQALLSGY